MACVMLCCYGVVNNVNLSLSFRSVQTQFEALTLLESSGIASAVLDRFNMVECRLAGPHLLRTPRPTAMLVIERQTCKTAGGVRVCGRWWAPAAPGGLIAAMPEYSEGQGLETPDT